MTGSKTPDVGVRVAMLKALYEVVSKAGGNMSEASRTSLLSLVEADDEEVEGMSRPFARYSQRYCLTQLEDVLIVKARLLGALVKYLSLANAKSFLKWVICRTGW